MSAGVRHQNLIYGLIDPETREMRYVGLSKRGLKRPRHHLHPKTFNGHDTHLYRWVRSVVARGLLPEIVIIEYAEAIDELPELERGWISYFRALGCDLTNMTDGGDGLINPTPEVRAKMVATRSRPEVKAQASTAQRQAWSDPDLRARHAETLANAYRDPDKLARKVAALKRPEVRDKISTANVKAWQRPGEKARRGLAIALGRMGPERRAHLVSRLDAEIARLRKP